MVKWNQITLRTILRDSLQEDWYRLGVKQELFPEDEEYEDEIVVTLKEAIESAAREFAATQAGVAFLADLKRLGYREMNYLCLGSIPAEITVKHGFIVLDSVYPDITLDNISLLG